MNILLLGKNGQVGWELQRSLATLGCVTAVDLGDAADGLCGDLTDLEGLAETVRRLMPNVIVNAAAYTAVDRAESEPDLAHRINAQAPGVLAGEAQKLGAWLIHYSTDYVFDGSGDRFRREDDPTGPLNVYGQTKLEGEQAVARCEKHLIFRTSWVYASRGNNFARTMLRLATERNRLQVIDDQIGAPTGAELLADVTAFAIRTVQAQPELTGLYHLVAGGDTSWHAYARLVIGQAMQVGKTLRAGVDAIEAIPTRAYPTPARRPLNSRLNTEKVQRAFGLHLPDWEVGVKRMLAEIIG